MDGTSHWKLFSLGLKSRAGSELCDTPGTITACTGNTVYAKDRTQSSQPTPYTGTNMLQCRTCHFRKASVRLSASVSQLSNIPMSVRLWVFLLCSVSHALSLTLLLSFSQGFSLAPNVSLSASGCLFCGLLSFSLSSDDVQMRSIRRQRFCLCRAAKFHVFLCERKCRVSANSGAQSLLDPLIGAARQPP